MSYQEKRALVSLLSNFLISAVYFGLVLQGYRAEAVNMSDEFHFWGEVLLVFIPVQIVFRVIILIVFSIFNTLATHEEEPPFTDELDKLIELKAVRNFCYVFMAGFFLSMGALVIERPPSTMFSVLSLSLVIAGATDDLSQLYYYRRGV